jgi:hypothetical protein
MKRGKNRWYKYCCRKFGRKLKWKWSSKGSKLDLQSAISSQQSAVSNRPTVDCILLVKYDLRNSSYANMNYIYV